MLPRALRLSALLLATLALAACSNPVAPTSETAACEVLNGSSTCS